MADLRAWFHYSRFHSEKLRTDTRLEGRCGIVFDASIRGSLPEQVMVPDDTPYPKDVCSTCMLEVAFDDVVEESTDECRARGFLPAPPVED